MARAATTKQARELARMRAQFIRDNDRKEVAKVREALRAAQARRRSALAKALKACARARRGVSEKIRAYRSEQMARINHEVKLMRNQARARCQSRRHRIRESGARQIDKTRADLRELARYQRQVERLAATRKRRQLSTSRERAQEDDDAVRSNLPRELRPVFERVKRVIKGSRHRSRTEAFLEWAESHPEDVLAYQGDETEREVRALIAQHEAAQRQLRKTRPARARRRAAGDGEVPF